MAVRSKYVDKNYQPSDQTVVSLYYTHRYISVLWRWAAKTVVLRFEYTHNFRISRFAPITLVKKFNFFFGTRGKISNPNRTFKAEFKCVYGLSYPGSFHFGRDCHFGSGLVRLFFEILLRLGVQKHVSALATVRREPCWCFPDFAAFCILLTSSGDAMQLVC